MTRYDVAVVGGGIAGTSAAYFLADRADVVLIEREQTLGVHATGRSAAVFTECYGKPVVRRLAIASRGFLENPPDGFSDPPILSERGILFVASAAQASRIEEAVVSQRRLVESVRGLDGAEAIALCPVLDRDVIVGGVFEPGAMDLDVHALHMGFQRGLRKNGSEINKGTGLDSANWSGTDWVVRCGDDEIRAGVLVNAAGAWCDQVAAACGVSPVGLVPKRRTAFSFGVPDGVDHRSWPMVIDLDEEFYFKPDGAGLLGSPADEMPMEPHDVRHREEDVALGIERIQAATTMTIRSIRSAWAGLRSFVADHTPVNGWDDAAPGFYWLAGQGGFGIKTSPAMGAYAAAMILDGSPSDADKAVGLDPVSLGIERLR